VKKKGFLRALFNRSVQTEEFLENLEAQLIEGDLGARSAMEIVEEVEKAVRSNRAKTQEDVIVIIREKLQKYLRTEELELDPSRPTLLLMMGVNGVGKTTSLAKLAHYFREQHQQESLLVAADTFRAAAIDQLQEHGKRLNFRVVRQNPGSDPGAVIYDGIHSAKSSNIPIILVDTAGRMHTKANLVRELQKIDKVIKNRLEDGVYKKLLVIDATTGQNGVRQAEMFHEAIGLDGAVLAKYDSASKAGAVVSICRQIGVPFYYMGTGEKYGDIEPFNKEHFLDILLSDE
jgi:fused signal recognition particle receptor